MYELEILRMLHLIHCENELMIKDHLSMAGVNDKKIEEIWKQYQEEMDNILESINAGCDKCHYKQTFTRNKIKEDFINNYEDISKKLEK